MYNDSDNIIYIHIYMCLLLAHICIYVYICVYIYINIYMYIRFLLGGGGGKCFSYWLLPATYCPLPVADLLVLRHVLQWGR